MKSKQKRPNAVAYRFISEKGASEISFEELDARSRSIAAYLQQFNARGERAVILLQPSFDYIATFLGCLYAGVVAVPAYPPRKSSHIKRLKSIVEDAQAKFIFTSEKNLLLESFDNKTLVLIEHINQRLLEEYTQEQILPDDLAFLQYTSGSTGSPKGVMVSHRNIVANIQHMDKILNGKAKEVRLCSWLPPYHDMGLIGGILFPLFYGTKATLMAPYFFLRNPLKYLQVLSEEKITLSVAPNFAYDLCVKAVKNASFEDLDLSHLKALFNGAEPISAKTIHDFNTVLKPYGLCEISMCPCYGMAEATLLITSNLPTKKTTIKTVNKAHLEQGLILDCENKYSNNQSVDLVGCGYSDNHSNVLIVNPSTKEVCSDGIVGEIWVKGPSISKGYWNKDALSLEVFGAYIKSGQGPYLKTGDLGFFDESQELFVTGRIKDLIIIQGRNIYPHDIEVTVSESHPKLIQHGGAAFGIHEHNVERLIIVQEVKRHVHNYDEIFESIIKNLMDEQEVVPSKILLVQQATLPKTSSGKVQRSYCRQLMGENALNVIKSWEEKSQFNNEHITPRNSTEQALCVMWADILKISPSQIGVQDNFFKLGGQSLKATQLVAQLRSEFKLDLPLKAIFESPNIESLASLINQTKAESCDVLPALVEESNRHAPFPLTDIQQAYWLGRKNDFELGSVSTYIYLEYDYSSLNLVKLEAALNKLIERHDALRLIFTENAQQQVLESVPHYQIDISKLKGNDHQIESELNKKRAQLSHQILPSDAWPLFSIKASCFNGLTRLHIGIDALILDAWSMMLVFTELASLYRNPKLPLPKLDLSFRNYVLTMKSLEDSKRFHADKQYWLNRIENFPKAPLLPLQIKPNQLKSQTFSRSKSLVEQDSWDILKSKAEQNGLTPSALLASAYAEVLSRWSESSRFALNLTLFNRLPLHPQVDQIAGDFTSLLLLEVNLSHNKSFLKRAISLQEQLWDDLDHTLYSALRFLRDLNRYDKHFSSMPIVFTCILGNKGNSQFSLDPSGRLIYGISQTPQVWLDNQIYESEDGLVIQWDYIEGLFPDNMVQHMHSAYLTLLNNLIDDDSFWDRLSVVSLPEIQRKMRDTVNATKWDIQPQLLQQLFHNQVALTPNHAAVLSKRRSLNYTELQRFSNKLARKLRELDVCVNELIAVVMEKGWEQVVAVLGILNSGAAYLPIDPQTPKKRLEYLLDQANIKIVLTQSKYNRLLEDRLNIVKSLKSIIAVDQVESSLSDYDDSCLSPVQSLNNLAYAIFTSGSTGMPKGVMMDHRAVSNTLLDINDRYKVSSHDRILSLSSLSFDLSVYDIFGALASGAAIVLPGSDELKEALSWTSLIRKYRVSIWNTVPAFMEMLCEALESNNQLKEQISHYFKLIMLSGDHISVDLAYKVKSAFNRSSSGLYFISLGGATEAAIWSISYPIKNLHGLNKIPYGMPLRNQRVYVLDQNLNACPDYVVGDIYIAGSGLAQGYFKDKEKTRISFITHPSTNERMYKTGDIGRYLPTGTIEFSGRLDGQVKIRGHRVELGEIEHYLKAQKGISQVVVDAPSDDKNIRHLVAFIVLSKERVQPHLTDNEIGSTTNKKQLQLHLKRYLPEYMVPNHFVFLENLPLTANGKLDRKRLADFYQVRSEVVGQTHSPPTNPLELGIAEIWSEVLEVEKDCLSIHDNFFDLGGHSLKAAQVISRIRNRFNQNVSLKLIFEYPTIAGFCAHTQDLFKHSHQVKNSLIQVLKKMNKPDGPTALSYTQQRLWVVDSLLPASLYNIPMIAHLKGDLNLGLLIKAFNEILFRHDILRTVFKKEQGGEVRQYILNAVEAISVIDIRGQQNKGFLIEEHKRKEALENFDLENQASIRAKIIHVEDQEYLLLITMHHIISDAWSIGILKNEISEIYNAYVVGKVPQLKKLELQYSDFSLWQREWLKEGRLESQLEYWKSKLSGIPNVINLPSDRPRPKELTYQGGWYSQHLGNTLSHKLKVIAKDQEASLYMFLLSALQVLLHKLTGEQDIVVGSPIANRHFSELESIVGCFANTLVMRGRIDSHRSFKDLLDETKVDTLESYNYQDVPFDQIVESLGVERQLNRNPIFQILFVMQNAGDLNHYIELEGVDTCHEDSEYRISKFDLQIEIYEDSNGGLRVTIGFMKDLFELSTITRFSRYFQRILIAVVEDIDVKVRDISILDENEKNQLLKWSSSASSPLMHPLIHKMYENAVHQHPQNIAVEYRGKQMTYQELNQRSNQLARHLKKQGVNREAFVALSLNKSLEMVVAILAILKAEAAFVPIDPDYPKERIQFILKDSQAKVLLTQTSLQDRFDSSLLTIVNLNDSRLANDESSSNNSYVINGLNAAGVIYTSGSTGKPKGVVITHQNITNRLAWLHQLQTHLIDKKCSIANFAFIDFYWELFSSFSQASTCVLFDRYDVLDPSFLERLDQHQVGAVSLTPSLLKTYLNHQHNQCQVPRSILDWQVSGEFCSQNIINAFFSQFGEVDLFNRYGSTEAMSGIMLKLAHDKNDKKGFSSKTFLCNNSVVYVLDKNLDLLPVGVIGEIYIGGLGVARGYVGKPGMTAEKFIANPFSSQGASYSRLYKTGDMGKLLPDGSIDVIGRAEGHTKIRGFRVELDEVVTLISECELVSDCIVTHSAIDEEGGLVAYVIPSQSEIKQFQIVEDSKACKVFGGAVAQEFTEKLKQELAQYLPDYMLPSSYVLLEQIPLSINGKVNMQALPRPSVVLSPKHELPTNETERVLIQIWSDVLSIAPENISVSDNFFKIGGHSLKAIQVISRIRKTLKVNLALSCIFETPTVAGLSKQIHKEGLQGQLDGLMLTKQKRAGPIPLSFAQSRLWFLDQLIENKTAYSMPAALSLKGDLNLKALSQSLNAIVERHESLRTSIQTQEDQVYQVIVDKLDVPIKHIDLTNTGTTSEQYQHVLELAHKEASTPFELSKAPLLRAKLIHLKSDEYVFLFTMHHIISDGWSVGILVHELGSLYNHYAHNRPINLNELSVHYADFAIWQRNWLKGEILDQQLNYWKKRLESAPDTLNLPYDYLRPSVLSYKGSEHKLKVNKELTQKLKLIADQEDATLFMLLLAVLQTLLYRYTNQEDILIGCPVAARKHKEVEGLIGFFVNTLVMRGTLSANLSFKQLLQQVKEGVIQAQAHQDIPFEQLVDHLESPRHLNKHPLFQVMFVLQNTKKEEVKLEGLSVESLEVTSQESKFDLSFNIGRAS